MSAEGRLTIGVLEMRPCLLLCVICNADAWNEAPLGSVPLTLDDSRVPFCPMTTAT